MNPHYFIDGYNLIHQVPRFKKAIGHSLEQSRNMLMSFIRGYLSQRNARVTLIFDGADVGYVDNRTLSSKRLKVIFSNSPEKADPLIMRLIKADNNKKSAILVSADNELINFAKKIGTAALNPLDFYNQAIKHPVQDEMDKKYERPISESELKEWMEIFGEDS
ncbi:hypothetical protein B6I21_03380 [candidate division KSB1 bacterium 4572_119]|nr:MAG: hypothetical protein B6I21_03380 [candidate division KSB1 bacterium 4572_119]